VSQNWPWPIVDYWTATRAPNPAEYDVRPVDDARVAAQ